MSDKNDKIKITDIEELEKRVKELESEVNYLRQYKDALDKTTIISKTDTEGTITDVNEMFEKISGYSKDELLGKPHNIVRHPDMPKAVFKKMWQTIQGGKIFKGVIKNKKKDGGEYYVLANVVPIKDEEGNIKEYIAIRQDITKRMQLQKAHDEFTKGLIRYFLKKIKNPNYIINKYSTLIDQELESEKPDIEKIKKYNLLIKREALMLDRVFINMEQILEFKENKVKPKIEPLYLTKALQYLFKKYKRYFNKKISFKIEDKNILINTDKKLFLLCLENLFLHSLVHAKKELVISLKKEGEDILLRIEYDGELIKHKKKIFDFFNQLKHSENIEEIGIGMYNSKKICNIFEYEMSLNEENDKNILTLKLKHLPPKKLL
ncbi:MAG: PAS domain S-box protein [Epsilonproteobacteria bacterium]|nr:PAS domain S-box protein [Campylobacterota bacterium]